MAREPREKPARLAAKLLHIRRALGLSQTEILQRMGLETRYVYTIISRNENGTREPTLIELLRYARLAQVPVEVLIDDGLDLPAKFVQNAKS